MTSTTEILSVKILLLIYLVLVLPWIFATQSRVRRLFGTGFSTFLNVLRCLVIFAVLAGAAGLTLFYAQWGTRRKVVLLEDRSLSMRLPASSGSPLTRAEAARMAAEQIESALGHGWKVERLRFGEKAVRAEGAEREREIEGSTDIQSAVREAVSLSGGQCPLVLISDGRVTRGSLPPRSDPGATARVYSVLVGDEPEVFDASITDISLDEPSYEGEEVPLEVQIAGFGTGERGAALDLSLDGTRIEKREVTVAGSGTRMEMHTSIPAMQPGMHLVTVELQADGDEFTALNNHRRFYVDARGSKRKVLLFSNSPDWDFTFFDRDAGRLSEYERSVFVEAQNGRMVHLDGAHRFSPVDESGTQLREALGSSSVIVLHGDLARVPQEIRGIVSARWRRGGVGVLLMPSAPWRDGASFGELEPLCPYRDGVEAVAAGKGTIQGATGTAHPVVTNGLGRNFGEWGDLPPLQSVLIGVGLRSGFSEILTSTVEGNVRVPVMLGGEGDTARELVLLASGYWQWDMFPLQYGRGPYFGKLIRGILEWLSEPARSARDICQPSAASLRWGDGIGFSAPGGVLQGSRIEVEISRSNDSDSTWSVGFGEGGSTKSTPLFLPPGAYRYVARENRAGEGTPAGEGLFLVDESSPEFDDPRPDRSALESLAGETGGGIFTLSGVPDLIETLGSESASAEPPGRFDLRRQPASYLAVLLIFFLELAVRRRKGLP